MLDFISHAAVYSLSWFNSGGTSYGGLNYAIEYVQTRVEAWAHSKAR